MATVCRSPARATTTTGAEANKARLTATEVADAPDASTIDRFRFGACTCAVGSPLWPPWWPVFDPPAVQPAASATAAAISTLPGTRPRP